MQGCMIHYYLFKKAIDSLPKPILNELDYNDDLLFNLSNFTSTSAFFYLFNPFKTDKYALHNKMMNDSFDNFIFECIIKIKKYDNFLPLLFIFGMISYNIYSRYLTQYINSLRDEKITLNKALNMLDYFYTLKNDNFDLSKMSLNMKFKDGFIYYDYMDDLIHEPLIKVYSFFCSKSYYSKSYKRKEYFYKHMTRSKTKIKNIGYIIYDSTINIKSNIKACDYIYSKNVDTKLLNLINNEYYIDGNKYNLNFDDMTNLCLKEILKYYNAIIDYVFFGKDKSLKQLYNLNDDYKIEQNEFL